MACQIILSSKKGHGITNFQIYPHGDVYEDEEIVYEIELEEGGAFKGDQSATRSDYKGYKGTDKGYHGKTGSSHGDQGEPDDYLDEGDDWGSDNDNGLISKTDGLDHAIAKYVTTLKEQL